MQDFCPSTLGLVGALGVYWRVLGSRAQDRRARLRVRLGVVKGLIGFCSLRGLRGLGFWDLAGFGKGFSSE